jgi:cob(I)alamin adenosyltransferase
MSIVTKTGDEGDTSLMYGRRVPKTHPRIEACGAIDELNAVLGLARATADQSLQPQPLLAIQKDLVALMGELATATEDLPRYQKDGFAALSPTLTARLDTLVRELESQNLPASGWATPGANPQAATLDLARTVCRRAERCVCALKAAGELPNPEIVVYLNRLSDLLWLLARKAEANPSTRRV